MTKIQIEDSKDSLFWMTMIQIEGFKRFTNKTFENECHGLKRTETVSSRIWEEFRVKFNLLCPKLV